MRVRIRRSQSPAGAPVPRAPRRSIFSFLRKRKMAEKARLEAENGSPAAEGGGS